MLSAPLPFVEGAITIFKCLDVFTPAIPTIYVLVMGVLSLRISIMILVIMIMILRVNIRIMANINSRINLLPPHNYEISQKDAAMA